MDRPRVVALVGPTGVGKTALALALAEHTPLEVVSADSRAVYRWMDIGTAKPSPAERRRVPHHLLDVVDPDEAYSLAVYQQQARAAIGRIQDRGRLPLLVGGAGLYVSAVCDGLVLPDVPPNPAFRLAMQERVLTYGWAALQADLARVDPVSAQRIDPKNVRRVIRALEVQRATGRPFSAWQARVPEAELACTIVGLRLERSALYARLDQRIDGWLEAGFLDEVRGLLERGYRPTLPSMSGLGYREMAQVIAGELTLEDGVARLKQATHQYSKRQLTWFGRDARIHWFDAEHVSARAVLDLLGEAH